MKQLTLYMCTAMLGLVTSLAGYAATMSAMTMSQQSGDLAFQLFVTDAVTMTSHRLEANPDKDKPARFFMDIDPVTLAPSFLVPTLDDHPMIKAIRVGKNAPDKIRLVFDLSKQAASLTFSIQENDKGLLIVAKDADKVLSAQPPVTIDLPVKPEAKTVITKAAPKPAPATYRIIIDPGHGGKDPGARGSRGGLEKNVVLSIAKKVKALLADKKKYTLYMTRTKDEYIALLERTKFANRKKGDLFVSIHANASPRKSAKGVSTYFLNNADDQESLRVATRENGELDPSKLNIPSGSDDYYLELMKASMVKNFHTSQSTDLARWVQRNMVQSLRKNYSDVVDLGVRSARFYVLTGSTMPSILVETSFISNPTEEKRLTSSTYQNRMAKAIVQGIEAYFKEVHSRQQHTAMLQ